MGEIADRLTRERIKRSMLPSVNGPLTLTSDMIHQHKTAAGAWTRAQIEALGLTWPPRHGWISRLVGTTISQELCDEFVAGREIRASADTRRGINRAMTYATQNVEQLALSGAVAELVEIHGMIVRLLRNLDNRPEPENLEVEIDRLILRDN